MGLSFLQGTFLMAQVDFADGKAHRGYASVALGLSHRMCPHVKPREIVEAGGK
jgi:hypothetical protein